MTGQSGQHSPGQWTKLAISTVQGLATLRMRATAAAIFLFILNIVGSIIMPALVGWLSDMFSARHGNDGLGYALLVLSVFNLWGATHSWMIGRSIERDLHSAGTKLGSAESSIGG